VETFRCPTCLGVLDAAAAGRCAYCGQNLRRRRPRVLGDEHRLTARLPIDRWMLARLHESGLHAAPAGAAPHGWVATDELREVPGATAAAAAEHAPVAPRPSVTPPPPAEELDPEVRALVDELYRRARAELSGDDPSGPRASTMSVPTWSPAPRPAAPEGRANPVID
jgi:hypothetical protein